MEVSIIVIDHVLAQCASDQGLCEYLKGLTNGGEIPDNRRTCRQCANLRIDVCKAQSTSRRKYRPQVEVLFRCEWYEPGDKDPDRRPVTKRWPGMSLVLGQG